MNIISGLDTVGAVATQLQGEVSGVDSGLGVLETAYIEIKDNTSTGENTLTNSKTKSILSGLTQNRSESLKDSKQIKVQFNPESLSFSYGGSGAKKEKTSIVQNDEGKATQAAAQDGNEAVNISFRLVFDRSIYKDCSVQPEVEQFLALIKKPYIREITFYWGTMCYEGIVRSIDAEYVLFNSKGVPMRANVNMSMQVIDKTRD
jgi:hypothetical protein